MTIRTFLIGITAATLVCFLSWIAISVFFDPEAAGWIGLVLFYFSLFLWVCGLLISVGFYTRHLLRPNALPYPLLTVSARQAVIASTVLAILLILQGARTLNWINGTFLLIAVIFIEGYFLNFDHKPR